MWTIVCLFVFVFFFLAIDIVVSVIQIIVYYYNQTCIDLHLEIDEYRLQTKTSQKILFQYSRSGQSAFLWVPTVPLITPTYYPDPLISPFLSPNNSKISDYYDRIYLIEREMRDTTNTARSASNIDRQLETDIE